MRWQEQCATLTKQKGDAEERCIRVELQLQRAQEDLKRATTETEKVKQAALVSAWRARLERCLWDEETDRKSISAEAASTLSDLHAPVREQLAVCQAVYAVERPLTRALQQLRFDSKVVKPALVKSAKAKLLAAHSCIRDGHEAAKKHVLDTESRVRAIVVDFEEQARECLRCTFSTHPSISSMAVFEVELKRRAFNASEKEDSNAGLSKALDDAKRAKEESEQARLQMEAETEKVKKSASEEIKLACAKQTAAITEKEDFSARLSKALDDAKRAREESEQARLQMEAEIEKVKKGASEEIKLACAKQTAELGVLQDKLRSVGAEYEITAQRLAEAQQDADSCRRAADELQRSLTAATTEKEDFSARLSKALDDAKRAKEESEQARLQMEAEIEKVKKGASEEIKLACAKQTAELGVLQDKLRSVGAEYEITAQRLAEAQQDADGCRRAADELQRSLTVATTEKEDFSARLSKALDDAKRAQEEAVQARREAAKSLNLQETLASIQSKHTKLMQDHDSTLMQLHSAEGELRTLNFQTASLRADAEAHTQRNERLIQELRGEVETSRRAREMDRDALAKAQKDKAGLGERIEAVVAERTALQRKLDDERRSLLERCAKTESQLQELSENALSTRIVQLQAELTHAKDALSLVEAERTSLANRVRDLTTQSTTRLEALNAQHTAALQALQSETESRVADLTAQQKANVERLNRRLQERDEEVKSLREQVRVFQEQKEQSDAAAHEKVTSLEQQLHDSYNDLEAVAKQVEEMRASVPAKMSEHSERYRELNEDMKKLAQMYNHSVELCRGTLRCVADQLSVSLGLQNAKVDAIFDSVMRTSTKANEDARVQRQLILNVLTLEEHRQRGICTCNSDEEERMLRGWFAQDTASKQRWERTVAALQEKCALLGKQQALATSQLVAAAADQEHLRKALAEQSTALRSRDLDLVQLRDTVAQERAEHDRLTKLLSVRDEQCASFEQSEKDLREKNKQLHAELQKQEEMLQSVSWTNRTQATEIGLMKQTETSLTAKMEDMQQKLIESHAATDELQRSNALLAISSARRIKELGQCCEEFQMRHLEEAEAIERRDLQIEAATEAAQILRHHASHGMGIALGEKRGVQRQRFASASRGILEIASVESHCRELLANTFLDVHSDTMRQIHAALKRLEVQRGEQQQKAMIVAAQTEVSLREELARAKRDTRLAEVSVSRLVKHSQDAVIECERLCRVQHADAFLESHESLFDTHKATASARHKIEVRNRELDVRALQQQREARMVRAEQALWELCIGEKEERAACEASWGHGLACVVGRCVMSVNQLVGISAVRAQHERKCHSEYASLQEKVMRDAEELTTRCTHLQEENLKLRKTIASKLTEELRPFVEETECFFATCGAEHVEGLRNIIAQSKREQISVALSACATEEASARSAVGLQYEGECWWIGRMRQLLLRLVELDGAVTHNAEQFELELRHCDAAAAKEIAAARALRTSTLCSALLDSEVMHRQLIVSKQEGSWFNTLVRVERTMREEENVRRSHESLLLRNSVRIAQKETELLKGRCDALTQIKSGPSDSVRRMVRDTSLSISSMDGVGTPTASRGLV